MKSKYLKFVLLSAIICFSQIKTVVAQVVNPCATDEMTEQLYLQHPELRQAYIDYVNDLKQRSTQKESRSTTLYTIPMVFHVIHVNGTENVSDANIIAQVAKLNTDYRKLNADITSCPPYFQSIAGDAIIQFKLAKIDPNGNCTNGIDRIYSHKTFDAGERSKLNQWPRDKYFNVWVINTLEVDPGTIGLVLAYATFPSSVNTFGFPSDGVIMRSDQCNGTSRTLTHETGHWLSLEHTWGSGQVATACGDDAVNDTPVTKGHFSTCPSYDFFCDNTVLLSSYAFSGVTTSSGTTDPTSPPYVADSTMTFSSFSSAGVSANSSAAAMFSYSNWDTGGVDGDTVYASHTGVINTGKYYQFTVTPDLNVDMTLTGITFDFQRDTDGVRTYVVRSSADGYTTNLPASISPTPASDTLLKIKPGNVFYSRYDTTSNLLGSKITLSGAAFSGKATPITFRIYGYNAETSTGTFGIDNLVVTGTFGDAENVNNYMDYSSCIYMFTQDQVTRMRNAVESNVAQRSSLWIASNLAATGTDGGVYTNCTPSTDFYADDYMICPAANIAFTANVLNLTPTAVANYSWTFPGGTPGTAITANPVVVYNTPGAYNVTLTVGSSGTTGTTTVTKTNMIYVNDPSVVVPNTFSEGFENAASFYSKWIINDLDNNSRTWWKNSTAAYTGSNSIVMNAYYSYWDDVDQLISPSYNLTFITAPVLQFRCAAATNATFASDMNDKLIVSTSIDCGASWLIKRTFTGAGTAATSLINNSYHPEEFIPSSASQWALLSVTGIPTGPNVRVKFEYLGGRAGNSIYIDDINMTGVLGIDENSIEAANVSIYPNPSNQTATLSYHLNVKGDTKIELIDVLGKKIMETSNNNQAEGDYNVQISKTELNLLNGIYFVKFTINNSTITKKLIITE